MSVLPKRSSLKRIFVAAIKVEREERPDIDQVYWIHYICFMECRPDCGACCIAPSISSAIPGMPDGKPAGVRCIHLAEDYKCAIYKHPDRPPVCDLFKADPAVCGVDRREAIILLGMLEDGDLSDEAS